ncbi:hypothetical protein SD70_13110 [Gordoniibacillus kamchatkensis]|uniref:Xylose isomerase-like TIM barrel domain-containing protein n=1 Tax=Gordoniibacillus kamchatkensis TaxID=1590651 RepID=A0ABR5AHL0_9BACL|nr:sugar phosphate isomerase/epimerase [Paenibacillus sp. VKM B-2647]KIL40502.1 hypothetical protein SD70_13110 [Paenibacillus sp. VKM B-2647]
MGKMKLGLQMWSIHDVCMKEGICKAIEIVKELGYDGFEFAINDRGTVEELFGVKPAEVKKALQANDVKGIGYHASSRLLFENPDPILKECVELEIPYAAIGPAFYGDRTPHKKQIEIIKKVEKAAKIFKSNGVQLQVHCAAYGYLHDYKGRYTVDGMFEDVGLEYLQPEFDTAWMICGGVDPAEYLHKYKGYVDILHFKDYRPLSKDEDSEYILVRHDTVNDYHFGCAVGDSGVLDIAPIVRAAEECGTKWAVTELWNEPDSLENARISAQNLKKYL